MPAMILEENLNDEDLVLSKLQSHFSFSSLHCEEGQRPIGFRFSKHIVNIIANLGNRKVIVCGEADTRDLAYAKAVSELVERSALISSSNKIRTENSNGWAAHPDKNRCQINAMLELVERDAVLAQWYSSTPFLQIPHEGLPLEIQNWASTELARSEFPKLNLLLSTKGLGPSVTCLLTNQRGFGVSAHSTKEDLHQSVVGAIAEACRAAHSAIRREYWQDSLKLKNGLSGSLDPSAHGVYYAYHEAFPSWMFGERIPRTEAFSIWQKRVSETLTNPKFSFQQVMELPIHVGFAKHPLAFDLRWERTDADMIALNPGSKRLNLKPETINEKPHIVS